MTWWSRLPVLLALALSSLTLARQGERRPAPPQPAKLKRAYLRIHSGVFSPKPDLNLHIYIYPGTQKKVEANERGGSILGYESRDRPLPIASASFSEFPLQGYTGYGGYAGVAVPLDKETFTRLHGGHFRLNGYWKSGSLGWWIEDPQLVLEFEDGTVQRVTFPRIDEKPGSGAFDFYFDEQFRVIQP